MSYCNHMCWSRFESVSYIHYWLYILMWNPTLVITYEAHIHIRTIDNDDHLRKYKWLRKSENVTACIGHWHVLDVRHTFNMKCMWCYIGYHSFSCSVSPTGFENNYYCRMFYNSYKCFDKSFLLIPTIIYIDIWEDLRD